MYGIQVERRDDRKLLQNVAATLYKFTHVGHRDKLNLTYQGREKRQSFVRKSQVE